MADSILTSITLAGGSFNVYYDTVLDVITVTSTGRKSCPSGWKAAVVISCITRTSSSSSTAITLIQPIPIFNNGSSDDISYYGTFINNQDGTYEVYSAIVINSSNFSCPSGGNAVAATIIFVA